MLTLPEDDYHLVSNARITNVVGAKERLAEQSNSKSRKSLLNILEYSYSPTIN